MRGDGVREGADRDGAGGGGALHAEGFGGGGLLGRFASVEPVLPVGLLLLALGGWGWLLATHGVMVLALTLFSPVSSTLIFAVIGSGLWLRGALRRQLRRTLAACAAAGECGACGYPLGEFPADGPGLRRCAECGAAWEPEGRPDRVVVVGGGAQRASSPRTTEPPAMTASTGSAPNS